MSLLFSFNKINIDNKSWALYSCTVEWKYSRSSKCIDSYPCGFLHISIYFIPYHLKYMWKIHFCYEKTKIVLGKHMYHRYPHTLQLTENWMAAKNVNTQHWYDEFSLNISHFVCNYLIFMKFFCFIFLYFKI